MSTNGSLRRTIGLREELRPDQILAHRFRWKLFGVRRNEVQRFLAEAATVLARARDALAQELLYQAALRKSLEDVTRRLQELEAQRTATQRRLAPHQELDQPMPRVPVRTGRVTVDAPGPAEPAGIAPARSDGTD